MENEYVYFLLGLKACQDLKKSRQSVGGKNRLRGLFSEDDENNEIAPRFKFTENSQEE